MNSNDVEIHEVVEEVSMKGPIKIEQSSSPLVNNNILP
jgi:hypothetical protein